MKHLINKGLLLVSAFVMIYAQDTATDTRLIIALLLSLIAGAIYPALAGISAVDMVSENTAENHSRIYPYISTPISATSNSLSKTGTQSTSPKRIHPPKNAPMLYLLDLSPTRAMDFWLRQLNP